MMLTRYEPWSAMQQLQNEMNRLFGSVLEQRNDGSNVVTSSWMPAADVKEEDDRFVIAADVASIPTPSR